MTLEPDVSRDLLDAYSKLEIDISKYAKKSWKLWKIENAQNKLQNLKTIRFFGG